MSPAFAPRLEMQGMLLTVLEAAEKLRVHPSTVYALCDRGELEHIRVSNAIRVLADAIETRITSER